MSETKKLRSIVLAAALLAAVLDPEKLKKVAQDAIDTVAEQEKSLETAQEFINELEAANEQVKKNDKNYRPEVKTKSGIFRIVHGVNLGEPKGVLLPEQIAKDLTLVESLYKSGSSAVVKVG